MGSPKDIAILFYKAVNLRSSATGLNRRSGGERSRARKRTGESLATGLRRGDRSRVTGLRLGDLSRAGGD